MNVGNTFFYQNDEPVGHKMNDLWLQPAPKEEPYVKYWLNSFFNSTNPDRTAKNNYWYLVCSFSNFDEALKCVRRYMTSIPQCFPERKFIQHPENQIAMLDLGTNHD